MGVRAWLKPLSFSSSVTPLRRKGHSNRSSRSSSPGRPQLSSEDVQSISTQWTPAELDDIRRLQVLLERKQRKRAMTTTAPYILRDDSLLKKQPSSSDHRDEDSGTEITAPTEPSAEHFPPLIKKQQPVTTEPRMNNWCGLLAQYCSLVHRARPVVIASEGWQHTPARLDRAADWVLEF